MSIDDITKIKSHLRELNLLMISNIYNKENPITNQFKNDEEITELWLNLNNLLQDNKSFCFFFGDQHLIFKQIYQMNESLFEKLKKYFNQIRIVSSRMSEEVLIDKSYKEIIKKLSNEGDKTLEKIIDIFKSRKIEDKDTEKEYLPDQVDLPELNIFEIESIKTRIIEKFHLIELGKLSKNTVSILSEALLQISEIFTIQLRLLNKKTESFSEKIQKLDQTFIKFLSNSLYFSIKKLSPSLKSFTLKTHLRDSELILILTELLTQHQDSDYIQEIQETDSSSISQELERNYISLLNEKEHLESRLKESEKIISSLKEELERKKENRNTDSSQKLLIPRRSSSEYLFNSYLDYDLTISSSGSNYLLEILQEEITNLIKIIKENCLVPIDDESEPILLRKIVEKYKKIKEILAFECRDCPFEDLDQTLLSLLNSFKAKIEDLEKDLKISNKKIEEFNSLKSIQNSLENSTRKSTPNCSVLKPKEIEENPKLLAKKHKIHLHEEQISLLKKNIRDQQSEIAFFQKNKQYISMEWTKLAKELPILDSFTEEMMGTFMKVMNIASSDIKLIQNERRKKKLKKN